ncbi:MAG: amidohydrolase family protein [Coriobacteriales bacterium]|nr:amidohydrolase family protein [Coriobacteriales bacterium]
MILKAKYLLPITSTYITDGAIYVKKDKILDFGPADELEKKYKKEKVIDYGQAALMPGLVDAHCHLAYSAMRGLFEGMPYVEWKRAVLSAEIFFTQKDWESSAKLGALEAIASGITTVADFGRTPAGAIAINQAGLRGIVYHEIFTAHADKVKSCVKDGFNEIESIAAHVDASRVELGVSAGHVYTCHPSLYQEISSTIGNSDLRFAMHAAGNKAESDFIKYGSSPFSVHASEIGKIMGFTDAPWLPAGCTPIRYLHNWHALDMKNVMLVHAIHIDNDDLQILYDNNVNIAYCPRINAKLGMGNCPVDKFIEAGLTVGLGTDSPASVDTTDLLDEMRFALMMNRSLHPDDTKLNVSTDYVLKLATLYSAKALNLDDKVGSIDIGKQADIIAVDLSKSHQIPTTNPANAVVYTCNQDNVMMTMVNGKILYDSFNHKGKLKRKQIVKDISCLRENIIMFRDDIDYREELLDNFQNELVERVKR